MIRSKVAKRYAKALFGLGQEVGKIQDYGKDLNAFAALYRSLPEFARVVSSPVFTLDERKRILGIVLDKSDLSTTAKNFLHLLLEKDRIEAIEGIADYYQKLMDEASNIARAEVVAARPLKEDALKRLEKSLGEATSKIVKVEVREDPSLIGGIVVKVGDLVLDGSIKAQLRGLRESL